MNKLTMIPSIIGEIVSFIGAVPLLAYAKYKKIKCESIDSTKMKMNKIPIILIHGKGFNKIEFIVGMQYLKKDTYGSVKTFDYAGLISNKKTDTIEDYCIITHNEIEKICNSVGVREIILIGHSLGGLIASCYAENFAKTNNIKVKMIITIATPWHEPPLLKYFYNNSSLNQQMKESYLIHLREKAMRSINKHEIYYYTISSKDDILVPKDCGKISKELTNHLEISWVGHNIIIISYTVWNHVRKLLNNIYND